MTISQANACQRLSALGYKQSRVHAMIDQVASWKKCNGVEWTVQRLKDLKNDYIHHLAGQPKKSSWIAYDGNNRPKGPFGLLWKDGMSPKAITRGLNALMAYSAEVSPEITIKQWNKFQSSVEKPQESNRTFETNLLDYLRIGKWKTCPMPKPSTLEDFVPGSTRVPIGKRSCPEMDMVAWWGPSCKEATVRIASQRFPAVFQGIAPDAGPFWSSMPDFSKEYIPSVGKIGFIQEAGFKLRAVANPNRIHQLALAPLKDVLLRLLREGIPQDCTHDQSKGVKEVQTWLKEGKMCHSIDLSDATNNFPLSLQLDVMRTVLPGEWKPWIDHFEFCSRKPWLVNDPVEKRWREIQWTKGQPLGLGPSFPAFALAHHVVLLACCKKENVSPSSSYVILGDDIVISNDRVKERYLASLRELGCPISASKTISSDRVAEFAGKVITAQCVYTPFKWREISDRSFLDSARNLGPAFVRLMKPRQRRVIEALGEVPEEFGGLGWNPKGKPLSVRLEEHALTIERLARAETPQRFSRTNSQIVKIRLEVQQASGRRLFDSNPFLGVAAAAAQSRPGTVNPELGARERVLTMLEPDKELFLDSESKPKGYRPVVKTSDPRGPDALKQLEDRLFSDDPSVKKSFTDLYGTREAQKITPSREAGIDKGLASFLNGSGRKGPTHSR